MTGGELRRLSDDMWSASDPFMDNLLGPGPLERWEPDDLASLLRDAIGKSFVIVASTTHVIAELLANWPRFEAKASDQDRRHLVLVRTYLQELLDLCISMSKELSDVANARSPGAPPPSVPT